MRSDDLRAKSYRADAEHNKAIEAREKQMNEDQVAAESRLGSEQPFSLPPIALPRITGLPVIAIDDRGRQYDITEARYDFDGALVLEIVEVPL